MPRGIGSLPAFEDLRSLASSNRLLAIPCIQATAYRKMSTALGPNPWPISHYGLGGLGARLEPRVYSVVLTHDENECPQALD